MTKGELRAKGLTNVWLKRLEMQGHLREDLLEDVHYVKCRECHAWQAFLAPRHLKLCCGLTLAEYRTKHQDHNTNSSLFSKIRKKTPSQRQAQSERLKARFQTPEGQITRLQIGEASKRMQASGYREQAAKHLRNLNADPEQRKRRGEETKARWESGEQRQRIAAWQLEHPEEVLEGARHARTHLTTTSKLHLQFKGVLDRVHPGFITEYRLGWYALDEALPEAKIAVEIDGCYWHGCLICGFPGVSHIQSIDARKSSYLRNRGWQVLRIPEHVIRSNIQACVDDVVATLRRLRND